MEVLTLAGLLMISVRGPRERQLGGAGASEFLDQDIRVRGADIIGFNCSCHGSWKRTKMSNVDNQQIWILALARVKEGRREQLQSPIIHFLLRGHVDGFIIPVCNWT